MNENLINIITYFYNRKAYTNIEKLNRSEEKKDK